VAGRKLRPVSAQGATIIKLLESAEATLIEASTRCNEARYHYGSRELALALDRITKLCDKIKYEDD
jgi:hypothetical protein